MAPVGPREPREPTLAGRARRACPREGGGQIAEPGPGSGPGQALVRRRRLEGPPDPARARSDGRAGRRWRAPAAGRAASPRSPARRDPGGPPGDARRPGRRPAGRRARAARAPGPAAPRPRRSQAVPPGRMASARLRFSTGRRLSGHERHAWVPARRDPQHPARHPDRPPPTMLTREPAPHRGAPAEDERGLPWDVALHLKPGILAPSAARSRRPGRQARAPVVMSGPQAVGASPPSPRGAGPSAVRGVSCSPRSSATAAIVIPSVAHPLHRLAPRTPRGTLAAVVPRPSLAPPRSPDLTCASTEPGQDQVGMREAGLAPRCTAHGLRKWGATRLAEVGTSENEIMAFLAHSTPREAARYTRRQSRTSGRQRAGTPERAAERVQPSHRVGQRTPQVAAERRLSCDNGGP